ncbi:hypothetical protein AAFF_G00344550 [Aldrovandia affinis]|uniref:Uncharacterized protein n=1 Tax=Aldrovandia affinis TaxID=143900 RepID=A0AAD7SK30_9TELE|nr:hypothetical protein AAFF_G00344550 [Aldrovandia affinis]
MTLGSLKGFCDPSRTTLVKGDVSSSPDSQVNELVRPTSIRVPSGFNCKIEDSRPRLINRGSLVFGQALSRDEQASRPVSIGNGDGKRVITIQGASTIVLSGAVVGRGSLGGAVDFDLPYPPLGSEGVLSKPRVSQRTRSGAQGSTHTLNARPVARFPIQRRERRS